MTFPSNLLGGLAGGGGQQGDAVVRMGVTFGNLRQQVAQGVGQIQQGMEDGQRKLQQGASGWTKVLGAIKTAAIGTGIGVAGALATGVASAISYESAFAGVVKTVDAAPAVLERLKKRFRELSTEIPISANELAHLGEAAGALGVPVDQIEEFVKVTALLGETTDVSSDQAATALGQLSNVLGLTGEDYNKFASTLVDLGNKGASTESQILEIASRAGAAGRLIGLTTPQILGYSSAVANLGIEVEAGGTALQTLFMQLQLFMNDKDKLALLGKTAEMTGAQFKKAFKEDANAALEAFFRGLGKQSDGGVAVLDALGLSGVRTSRAFLGLASTMDKNVEPALENANEAWDKNNALQIEAEKRFETTASKLTLLKNRLGDMLLTIGTAVLPKVTELVGWLADALPQAFQHVVQVWNSTLGPAVSRMADAFGGLLSTVIGIFTGGDKAVDWGAAVKGAFDTLAGILAETADFLTSIFDTLNALLGNEVVGNITRFVALWIGLRVAVDGVQRALRFILGAGGGGLRSFASFLTFGAVPTTSGGRTAGRATAAAQAAETAEESGGAGGHELELAARELRHAAHALEEAAGAIRSAAMSGGVPLLPGGSPAVGGMRPAAGTPLLTTSALSQAEQAGQRLWQQSAYAVTSAAKRAADGPFGLARQAASDATGAGRMLLSTAGSALAAPFRALGRVGSAVSGSEAVSMLGSAGRDALGAGKALASGVATVAVQGLSRGASLGASVLGRVGSAVGGALSFASKVFWPAMAGLFIADLAKAPIGDFVAGALGKQNLGAELKQDLFKGIGTILTSVLTGVDVEKIANLETGSFTIAGVTITRAQAAKMGLSRATMEEVFAKEATLEGTIERLHLADVLINTPTDKTIPTDLQPGTDAYRTYAAKIMERAKELGVDIQTIYQDEFGNGWLRAMGTTPNPEVLQKVIDAVRDAAEKRGEQYLIDFDEEVRKPTEEALKQLYGFNASDVALMSDTEIQQAAVLLSRNANGQYDAWFKGVLGRLEQELANHEPATPPKPTGTRTPGHFTQGAGAESTGPTSALSQQIAAGKQNLTDLMNGYTQFLNTLKDEGTKTAVDAASYWVQTYATQIAEAKKNPAVKKQLEDFFGMPLEEIEATLKAFKGQTGETLVVSMAQQFAANWEQAAKLGKDYAQDPVGLTVMNLLQQALDADILSPQAAKQIRQILLEATSSSTADAQAEVTTSLDRMFTSSWIDALAGDSDAKQKALTKAWKKALAESGKEVYPDATAKGEALMQAFIDAIPDKYKPTKDELEKLLKKATKAAQENSDPAAQASGAAFIQAMIDALPDKYSDFKAALYALLVDVGSQGEDDANTTGIPVGKNFVEGTEAGITSKRLSLIAAGAAIWGWVAEGMDQPSPALSRAITSKANYIKNHLPQSPVKEGPLKHPFLFNAGKKIIEQIGEGAQAATLKLTPKLDMPEPGALGAALGMGGQSIHADNINLYDARDEQDILARLQFLAPTGR